MDKFKELNADALAALAVEKRSAFDALIALDAPTTAQVEEAASLADEIEAIQGEATRRETEAQATAEKFASLKTRFAQNDDEGDTEVEAAADEDGDAEQADEPAKADDEDDDAEQDNEGEAVTPENEGTGDARMEPKGEIGARAKGVATLAAKTERPTAPRRDAGMVSITAAADVPEFGVGAKIEGLESLGKAVVNRMKGFAPPQGNGETVNLQQFGVANIRLPFEEDLIIDRHSDDMEVLYRAASESRLDGGSLVAAGGWCAPSETLYDLAADESLDGIISLPEVNVKRGGIRYTQGPQFSDFYANAGFVQTEAQAIAGTAKPCYEVTCPSFTDVRLDAVGVCIKVPILTNSAYPELVQRFISGTMIANQHMVNANVIGRLVTLAGAARVITGLGSSAADLLGSLELIADQRRQTYRLEFKRTLEVILPFWVKGNIRSDLANRNGVAAEAVTDQQIAAHFAARNLNVQYVYDWQALPTTDNAGTAGVDEANTYPATVDVLMYPAGTFVKGTSDVINLNAVYDAASLSTNVYTALFMEQGLLVAQMQYKADLIRVPLESSGRTGAANLVAAAGSWA